MESPRQRSNSIRNGASIGGRRLHRSASRSSTSSEIHVAPGPPTTSEQPPVFTSPMALSPKIVPTEAEVEVDILQGRILVVKARSDAARAFLASLNEADERNVGNDSRLLDEAISISDNSKI